MESQVICAVVMAILHITVVALFGILRINHLWGVVLPMRQLLLLLRNVRNFSLLLVDLVCRQLSSL